MVFAGWLNIYAAVYNEEFQSIFDASQQYGKQLLWIGTSVVLGIIILFIDERFYNTFAYIIYGIVILLLILVILIGTETKGATSWFEIGGFKIQPSEFANFPFDVQVQVDGTLLLIILVALVCSFLAYLNRKSKQVIVLMVAVFVASAGLIKSVDYIFNSVLEPHQSKRINVMLGLESDPKGAGYNVNQSLIAIGSGGISGKGFLEGTQTKYDFVPEQSTDFIFCTIGEEWGFLGSLVIIILFMALLLRIMYLTTRQRSDFARIYGYGVACILFFHFTINIGMTIGLAPVIGIPLPFFSYGGSSLWGFHPKYRLIQYYLHRLLRKVLTAQSLAQRCQ